MDLKRLGHIVALADEANFSRAAERVHLSQPAFSRSIQAAEHELGVRLFERGTGDVTTTPAGNFVAERARRVLQESRRLERDVLLYRKGMIGRVCIGAGPFVAASLLPQVVTDIRGEYPEAQLHIQVNNPVSMLEAVRREELDFFIGETRDVTRDGTFEVRKLGGQRGGFFVRAGHPLLAKEKLRMADLAPFGLATGRLPGQVRTGLHRAMGIPAALTLPVAVECDDTHVLRKVAMTTDTVMIASQEILTQEVKAGTMYRLALSDAGPAYTDLGVVSLAGRMHSPLAQHAIEKLAALAEGLGE
ncbi:LysR family transcriptional regulator [Caenimonas koreensis]|uniref:LysR family transcriptional regulator n=1 Tax=Caenimonas koreensis TaxID=367474 RepID=UPI003783E0BB